MWFIEYRSRYKVYRCLHVPTRRVYLYRQVGFDETNFPLAKMAFFKEQIVRMKSQSDRGGLNPPAAANDSPIRFLI